MSRILIALSLLLLCSDVHAQSSPWQLESRTTPGWTFTPGTSLGGLWDSGLTSGDSGESLFQQWVGTANPSAELDYNGRHSHVNLGYAGSFEKYFSQDMRWEQRGRFSAHRVVSSRVDVSGDASYSAVPTTDRLELTSGVVPFVTVNSRWLSTGGDVGWRLGPRLRVFGDYRFEQVVLDEPATASLLPFRQLRDGHSHAVSTGFTRDFSERLSLGVTGELRREYVGDFGGEFEIRTLTGEFSYHWTPALSVSGGGGISQLNTLNLDLQSASPTYHGGFERRLRTFSVSSRFDHGLQQLYGFGTLAATNTFTGMAFVPLADRLYYLNLSVAYSRTSPITDINFGLNVRTLWTDATVGRQLKPWLRGEGFVGVAHQGAPGTDSSNRLRVGIQIVTSKPLRIQ
jgi:hypothetical protein